MVGGDPLLSQVPEERHAPLADLAPQEGIPSPFLKDFPGGREVRDPGGPVESAVMDSEGVVVHAPSQVQTGCLACHDDSS